MKIIYLITVLALFITSFLIKEKNAKQDFIKRLIITITLFFGYNVIVCYALNEIHASINLMKLGIVNICVIIINLFFIIKNKSMQKYYINSQNLIFFCISFAISFIIISINTEFFTAIKYECTDGFVHYSYALNFSQNFDMMQFQEFMPFSYINNGIILNLFNDCVSNINLFKIYQIVEIFILAFIGISMFILINNKSKNKTRKIIAYIFSIMYMLAYSLNSVLYGYSYLTTVILIINVIMIIMKEYDKTNNIDAFLIIKLAILNFSLFFSYYLFAPFIYGSEFMYLTIRNWKKIKLHKYIFIVLILFLIPGILGIKYHLFTLNDKNIIDIVNIPGYTYVKHFTNFIILAIISIIYLIKNKKCDSYIYYILAFTVIQQAIMGIGTVFNVVSEYYFTKCSFILYGELIYISAHALIKYYESNENKKLIKLILLICILIISQSIYCENIRLIIKQDKFEKEDIELVYNVYKQTKENDEICLCGDSAKTNLINKTYGYNLKFDENLYTKEYTYILFINTDELSKQYIYKMINNNIELIYENSEGCLFKVIN